jgi:hypothetical protein
LLATELKDAVHPASTPVHREPDTGEMETVVRRSMEESRDIKMYKVKEDWIFDKQRSTMDIRIIGIAPMKEKG